MQVAASHAAQDVGKAAQYSDSLIAEKSVKVGSRFVSTETTAEEHSMTYRLQHVSVPRPPGSDQRTRAFYGALLGLQEIPAPVTIAIVDVIWFKLNESTEIHIFEEEPVGDRSIRHFCLVVEDLEAMRQKLNEAGYSPWDVEPIPGRPRFFCHDPNGNIIEFTTIVGNYLDYQDS